MSPKLFSTDTPHLQWCQFNAEGFSSAVSGVVFRAGECSGGMPLGGIGTGCLDLNTSGQLGLCSIFNSFVPPRDLNSTLLWLELDGRKFRLSTEAEAEGTSEKRCEQIHYWGHYPISDLEYELDVPVSAGLRAWAPFLPGDVESSNTPAIFFDVSVRNLSSQKKSGALVCTFPGPNESEARQCFSEQVSQAKQFRGVCMNWESGSYALAVLDSALAKCYTSTADRQAQVKVDFELAPGEEQRINLVLVW